MNVQICIPHVTSVLRRHHEEVFYQWNGLPLFPVSLPTLHNFVFAEVTSLTECNSGISKKNRSVWEMSKRKCTYNYVSILVVFRKCFESAGFNCILLFLVVIVLKLIRSINSKWAIFECATIAFSVTYRRSILRKGKTMFLFYKTSRPFLGSIQPPGQCVPELFLSGKAAVAEVNHSSPPNAEVKNEWSYTSTPSIRLRGVDRDNFTLFREDSLPRGKVASLMPRLKESRRYIHSPPFDSMPYRTTLPYT